MGDATRIELTEQISQTGVSYLMHSFLLASLLFLFQAPASIDGIVVREGTNIPVPGATVSMGGAMVRGDDGGRFSFRNVVPGRYRLTASHRDYIGARHNTEVSVGDGENKQGVVLTLTPLGSIFGRVVDDNGNPVANAAVEVLKYAYQDGRRIFLPISARDGMRRTNERGEYELLLLPPGSYMVRAVPADSQRLPIYYPNTANPALATLVDLLPGLNFTGVDIRITEVRSMRVTGTVVNGLTGRPEPGAALTLVPRRGTVSTGTFQRATSSNTGTFEFRNMAPGSYDVVGHINFSDQRIASSTPVEVANDDVEGVTLVLRPQIAINGTVAVENQTPGTVNPEFQNIRIELRHEPYIPGLLVVIPTVAPDGSFTLNGVTPGEYRLKLSAGSPLGYVKSARFGAIDALNPPFPIDGPGQIDIVIGLNPGSVDALVRDRDDKPFEDATVVLVPDPPRRQRFDLYEASATNASGRVHFDGVAPGDYRVLAWDEVPADSWQDADFLRPFEAGGKPIHVSEGSKETVELRLIAR